MRYRRKFITAVVVAILIMAISGGAWASLPVLKYGSRGTGVSQVQQLLKDWYYYDMAVDGIFGKGTQAAVTYFQQKNGLYADGIVGKNTYAALGISGSTPASGSRGSSDRGLTFTRYLQLGSRGDDVAILQSILDNKGYHLTADGIFGSGTKAAVESFQAASGIYADGVVGPNTIAKLNAARPVELIDWADIDTIFPRYTTALVTDVDTGISYTVYRMGGHEHADVEPLTAADTAKMLKSCGGTWSWARRAIIVTVNGHRIAASTNGMPHGQQTIYNNNMNGQVCIHFLNSRTHGSDNLDSAHQAMVQKAYNSQWQ